MFPFAVRIDQFLGRVLINPTEYNLLVSYGRSQNKVATFFDRFCFPILVVGNFRYKKYFM